MKSRVVALLLCGLLGRAQTLQVPAPSPRLQSIQTDSESARGRTPDVAQRNSLLDFAAPYRRPTLPALRLSPADRARSLVHDGAIYLSLYDAIALAIENNLDIEVARYGLSLAATDVLRSSGGGTLRGVDYSVAESPTGVGGPGSPLLNSAASSVTPTTPTVNDLTSLNILSSTTTDLSILGPNPFAAGPSLPTLQPTFVGQNTWFRRASTSSTLNTGAAPLLGAPGDLNFVTANYALVQGFSTGTQIELALNNATRVLYADKPQYNPFATPNTSVTVSQPLLRGFSRGVNLRYLRIAQINQKISRLLFDQQLISTVYGVARLYYDLVSLNENAQVKRETLTAARKLFSDNSSQVEQGTLAPLELTRSRSLVTSSELDLIQAEGLVHQQEVILKGQLAHQGSADPVLAGLPIVPTDRIVVPVSDDARPVSQLVTDALASRPDLVQASLQIESGTIALEGSRNSTLPELDLVGNFQTRGSSELPFLTIGNPGTGIINAPTDLGIAGLRISKIYQAGLQLNLPLKNHIAQADAARDLVQLRQAEARTQSLANLVRQQVETSLIALQTARSALTAATQSRIYQEQLVDAERDKLSVGASTNFLLIQQETYLAQARSTEVAARSVWVKARVALDRATGLLLERNNVAYAGALNAP